MCGTGKIRETGKMWETGKIRGTGKTRGAGWNLKFDLTFKYEKI
jgi:hypothetical protein